jgi:hypothetical protein
MAKTASRAKGIVTRVVEVDGAAGSGCERQRRLAKSVKVFRTG